MFDNSELAIRYANLDTPFLYIDKKVFLKNVSRLRNDIGKYGVNLRPHFKTIKSLDAAKYLLPEKSSPITVSTIKEAEALASAGYSNIVYAVGISVSKLHRVHQLFLKGVGITVLLDSMEQALTITQFCDDHNCSIQTLIEVDCDGHRGGVKPSDPKLVEIAKLLHAGTASFEGILVHAGESYQCFDNNSLSAAAKNEVDMAVAAANHLKSSNIPCNMISIGSTPTAHSYKCLEGITEVRAGVYGLFDLVMCGIGVCDVDDIAVSVVTTVIGHNKQKGWLLTDAGWMALSLDRGTANQTNDCRYGLIKDNQWVLLRDLQVTSVNQEHGIIETVNGERINFDDFPIGTRLHVLPNHACAMTSMHNAYHVFDREKGTYSHWTRIQGW